MTNQFNIDQVYQAFLKIRQESQRTIGLPEFVEAFRQLTKFFNHLNVVFSFIVTDLTDKFTILDDLNRNDSIHYRTVESMIDYERNREEKTGLVALLRLLRAFEFTYLFLQRAIVSPVDSTSPKQIAWNVYKETIYKRHSKAVRASVWLATATIPGRRTLRETINRGEIEANTAEKLMPFIAEIYGEIFRLYNENQFLELVSL